MQPLAEFLRNHPPENEADIDPSRAVPPSPDDVGDHDDAPMIGPDGEVIQWNQAARAGLAVKALPKPPVPLATIPAILASVLDPNHYRVGDGILGSLELTVVIGIGGIGKSRWVTGLGLCHAVGRADYCGIPLRGGPSRWLFIGSENSVHRLKFDLGVLMAKFTDDERAKAAENCRWYLPQDDSESKGGFLDMPESKFRISQAIKEFQPDVIVLDTLASLTCGLDLNKDMDMRLAVMHAFDLMRSAAPNAALLAIHHARPGRDNAIAATDRFSSGASSRNSKVLVNLARAVVILTPTDGDDESRFMVKTDKLNNAKAMQPIEVFFSEERGYEKNPDFDYDQHKESLTGKKPEIHCDPIAVVVAMAEGAHSRKEIVKKIQDAMGKVSEATVDRALRTAKHNKLIEPCPPFGSYTLTRQGQSAASSARL